MNAFKNFLKSIKSFKVYIFPWPIINLPLFFKTLLTSEKTLVKLPA